MTDSSEAGLQRTAGTPDGGMVAESLRLAVVHPSDELYGSDRVLLEVLPALRAEGAEVWLPTDLAYDGRLTDRMKRQGFRVRRVAIPVLRRDYMTPRGCLGIAVSAWSFYRQLRRSRPHLVYVSTTACAPAAVLARLVGASVLVHVHELMGSTERLVVGPMLIAARHVVVVSDSVRAALPRYVRRRAVVVPNGIQNRQTEVAQVIADAAPLTFIVASRWNSWKGHETLLKAWQQASMKDARLIVLGGPPPSGPSTDVPGLVTELGIESSVVILGEVEDVDSLLASVDVVLIPSLKEPFGLVAIEAARAAKATMASRTGGLAEIVKDGETGWLVTPGDQGDWSTALQLVTRSAARDLGRQARSRFERQFTGDVFRRRLEATIGPWLGHVVEKPT